MVHSKLALSHTLLQSHLPIRERVDRHEAIPRDHPVLYRAFHLAPSSYIPPQLTAVISTMNPIDGSTLHPIVVCSGPAARRNLVTLI